MKLTLSFNQNTGKTNMKLDGNQESFSGNPVSPEGFQNGEWLRFCDVLRNAGLVKFEDLNKVTPKLHSFFNSEEINVVPIWEDGKTITRAWEIQ